MRNKENLEKLTQEEANAIVEKIAFDKWERQLSSNRLPDYLLSNNSPVETIRILHSNSSYDVHLKANTRVNGVPLSIKISYSFTESREYESECVVWDSRPSSDKYNAVIYSGEVEIYSFSRDKANELFWKLEKNYQELIEKEKIEREEVRKQTELEEERKNNTLANKIISKLRVK